MMNRRLLLIAAIALLVTAAYAQRKTPKASTPAASATPMAKPAGKPVMDVVIGNSNYSGGNISKGEFDANAVHGVRIKNAQGAYVEGFSFTYGERNLYEDSVGNEKPVTEYLTEYCMGDTLSPIIRNTIAQRTKPGDTAYYDDIHIRMPDGRAALGKSMKFVITR
jgi:hypothetical protein